MNNCSYVNKSKRGKPMHKAMNDHSVEDIILIETAKKEGCCLDGQFVNKVKQEMEDEIVLADLADFFKVLGDSTRVKILAALIEGEMCVGTLTDILDMNQSAISHQLRILKAARLIRSRKQGKWVFYTLNDSHVEMIYKMGLEHIHE
jgi:ArsR family transcriptional regulator, lead/cadmium/zinc/bismuth-responsive transcriptional repressor